MCVSPIHLKRNYVVNHNHIALSYENDVPCGHCFQCAVSKRDKYYNLLRSANVHNAISGGKVAFLTFTYSEENLPFFSMSVDPILSDVYFDTYRGRDFGPIDSSELSIPYANYKDVQNFFKTLRHALSDINPEFSIKYLFASEYGMDERYTKRPHYHALLYINKPLSEYFLSEDHFLSFIKKYWRYGIVRGGSKGVFVDGFSNTPGYYVSKYIVKSKVYDSNPHYDAILNFVNLNHRAFVSYFSRRNYPPESLCVPRILELLFSRFPLLPRIRRSVKFVHEQIPYIEKLLSSPASDDARFYYRPSSLFKPLPLDKDLIKQVIRNASSDLQKMYYKNYLDILVTHQYNQFEQSNYLRAGASYIGKFDLLMYNLFYKRYISESLFISLRNCSNYFQCLSVISDAYKPFEFQNPLSAFELSDYIPIESVLTDSMLEKFDYINHCLEMTNSRQSRNSSLLYNHLIK